MCITHASSSWGGWVHYDETMHALVIIDIVPCIVVMPLTFILIFFVLQYIPEEGIRVFANLLHTHLVGMLDKLL